MTSLGYMTVNTDHIIYSDGVATVVTPSHPAYAAIAADLRAGNIQAALLKCDVKTAAKAALAKALNVDGGRIELYNDGTVVVDGVPMNSFMQKCMVEFAAANKDLTPLYRLQKRLDRNPGGAPIKDQLVRFLDQGGFPILDDGRFIAYKGVRKTEDPKMFASCHDKDFLYELETKIRIPRPACNLNPRETCAAGLHVGTHSYAKSYGDTLMEVIVDPIDVIAVPDGEPYKLRACALTVWKTSEHEYPNYVYTGDAAPTDEDWHETEFDEAPDEDELDDDEEELTVTVSARKPETNPKRRWYKYDEHGTLIDKIRSRRCPVGYGPCRD